MVSGGESNRAEAGHAAIGGGLGNTAAGPKSVVAGGATNEASGEAGSVGGGQGNVAIGKWSAVPGGFENDATGNYSVAAGRRAKAEHPGSFVWADSDPTQGDFASTGADQFLMRAAGGVGIGTTSPQAPLDVAGRIRSTGGELWATNHNNADASVHLSWLNDIARIRVGGTGVGATNGFDVQRTSDVSLMRILHNGNVGIGTTAPLNKLDVEGGAAIGATYSGTNVAPANGLIVEGNVGIGITIPTGALHVVGPAGDGSVVLPASSISGTEIVDGTIGTTDLANSAVNSAKIADGSVALADLAANSVDSRKIVNGTIGDADLASNAASLSKVSGGAMTATGGNVGIGVTGPDAKLSVNGDIALPWGSQIKTTNTTHDGRTILGIGWDATDGDFVKLYAPGAGATNLVSQLRLSERKGVYIDPEGKNTGNLGAESLALRFGAAGSGEGIASKRTTGTGQYGLDYYTNFTNRMTIANNGNVGIGTTGIPTSRLHVVGTTERGIFASSTDNVGVYGLSSKAGGGLGVYGHASAATGLNYGVRAVSSSSDGYDFYASGPGTDYGSSSSIRWKRNIRNIDDTLEKLSRLRGIYFDWDAEHGGHHDVGMIAEEVGEVLPEIVTFEENGVDANGMDYSKMTPLLVESVKALHAELQRVDARLDAQSPYDMAELSDDEESTALPDQWDRQLDDLRAENAALRAQNRAIEARLAAIEQRLAGKPHTVEAGSR